MKKYLGRIFLEYIKFFAKLQLKKFSPIIIGITGSAGKTSTRKAIVEILKHKGKVKESERANSESGIPLNILGITVYNYSIIDWLGIALLVPIKFLTNWKKYDYYVVEMGIDSPYPPKNMSYLLSIVRPHIGVVLNAGLAHTEPFDHLVKVNNQKLRQKKLKELISIEKGKLVTTMSSSLNVAVLNNDQDEIRNLTKDTNARIISFGKRKDSLVQFSDLKVKEDSFHLKISYNKIDHILNIKKGGFESNFAYTFSSAIAVGLALAIPPQKSIQYLEKYIPPAGRWNIYKGIKDSIIIDSSYNSSPLSAQRALKDLRVIAGRKNKIAILGDMKELGQESKQAHKDLGEAASKNANSIFLFGPLTKKYSLPIIEKSKRDVMHFEYIDDLIESVTKLLKNGSYVLVKGSQNGILLERVVEAFLKNKSDVKKLPRRGSYWDKVRKNTP